jgi:multiple sugar transport system permease protein
VSTGVRTREAAGAAAPDRRAAVAARARRRRRRRTGLYAAATLLALWVVVPMYLITLLAFRPPADVYRFPQSLLPTNLSLETMRFFLGYAGLLEALWRSLAVAAITLVLALAIGTPAGYALARFVFRGRSAYRLVILSTRAFPVVILSIPLAVFFLRVGLDDTIWAVAAVHTALALPFTVLITASVFVSVPPEYEEAAQTMGCTAGGAFARVVLPHALPGLVAAAIFTFEVSWNEVFAATLLTVEHQTLPALVFTTATESPLPFRFAAGWFLLAPSLLFILVVRKYLLGLGGVER